MTTEVAIYQTLSPDNAALAMRAEERIKARTVVTVIENGRDLLEVRNALGHGHFTQWLEQTFPFTDRTAQRWMNAAERYGGKTDIMPIRLTQQPLHVVLAGHRGCSDDGPTRLPAHLG